MINFIKDLFKSAWYAIAGESQSVESIPVGKPTERSCVNCAAKCSCTVCNDLDLWEPVPKK